MNYSFLLKINRSMWRGALLAVAVSVCLAPAAFAQAKPAVSCESLAKVALPNATITLAETVAAGAFRLPPPPVFPGQPAGPAGPAPQGEEPLRRGTPAGPEPLFASKLPAFCRVTATLSPSSDSDIKIEVWLPLDWNGKFIGAGNSGWAGRILQQDYVAPLAAGYAVAGTDTGHSTQGGSFIIGHPEKFIDYTWRADHEMTIKAKEIIKAFYGAAPKLSYWIGCSLGGQEALIEASKFPDDYNGIVAGAPLNPIVMFNAAQMWTAWLIHKNPEKLIPGNRWQMIHDAVLMQCGSKADLVLGYLSAPERCDFKPSSLLCKPGEDAEKCLTAPQVEFLTQYYEGPKNPRTGEHIYHGSPMGGELDMMRGGGASPLGVALDMYKYAVFQNPDWDWKTLDMDKDIARAHEVVDPLFRAYPEQVAEFLKKGGKLLIHMGGTEGFYGSDIMDLATNAAKLAGEKNADNIKLFGMPGMNHCGGGLGCDTFDKIGTIDAWVTQGKTPAAIKTYKLDNWKVVRTRPICAYPMVSTYSGSGSVDDAASYTCTK